MTALITEVDVSLAEGPPLGFPVELHAPAVLEPPRVLTPLPVSAQHPWVKELRSSTK